MKIAVCGKGGSGKSTVVALMANALPKRGYEVWVVDSDESNPGLYRLLGLDRRPRPLLELVGGKKKVFQAYSGDSAPVPSVLTRDQIRTEDLPSQYVVAGDHVRLVCVGKILQSLEGCACPMGALSREFLKRLSLKENEVVLVDTEAGIEHFGREVEASKEASVCLATVYLETEDKRQEVMRDVAWVRPQESGLEFITLLGTSRLLYGRIKSIDLLRGSIVLEGMENEHADL